MESAGLGAPPSEPKMRFAPRASRTNDKLIVLKADITVQCSVELYGIPQSRGCASSRAQLATHARRLGCCSVVLVGDLSSLSLVTSCSRPSSWPSPPHFRSPAPIPSLAAWGLDCRPAPTAPLSTLARLSKVSSNQPPVAPRCRRCLHSLR